MNFNICMHTNAVLSHKSIGSSEYHDRRNAGHVYMYIYVYIYVYI